MSCAVTMRSRPGDVDERRPDRARDVLVEFVGDHAPDVVRLHQCREVHGRGAYRAAPARGPGPAVSAEAGRPAGGLGGRSSRRPGALGLGAGRLADGVGQCLEVVGVRDRRREVADVPHDLPAARHRQAHRVLLAQVVGVRLGVGRQRADHGGEVGVGVGQRGHGRSRAPGLGAPPDMHHAAPFTRGTVSPADGRASLLRAGARAVSRPPAGAARRRPASPSRTG